MALRHLRDRRLNHKNTAPGIPSPAICVEGAVEDVDTATLALAAPVAASTDIEPTMQDAPAGDTQENVKSPRDSPTGVAVTAKVAFSP